MKLVGENVKLQKLANEIPLRRSYRVHRPTISGNYMVYLQEHGFDANDESDRTNFSQAISGPNSIGWMRAMRDELVSMYKNQV